MNPIKTDRLDLIPATLSHLDAELTSAGSLEQLLGARLPASWPPGEYDRAAMEFFRERLAADPASAGWYGWYAVDRAERVVVGAAGYLGPPSPDGTVEVGYSIAPEFRAQAYATEIVQALVVAAWSVPEVGRVIAHTSSGNAGSVKVLERAGFRMVGTDGESGMTEYEQVRATM